MQLTRKVYTAVWSFTVYTYDTLLIRAIALTLREKRVIESYGNMVQVLQQEAYPAVWRPGDAQNSEKTCY